MLAAGFWTPGSIQHQWQMSLSNIFLHSYSSTYYGIWFFDLCIKAYEGNLRIVILADAFRPWWLASYHHIVVLSYSYVQYITAPARKHVLKKHVLDSSLWIWVKFYLLALFRFDCFMVSKKTNEFLDGEGTEYECSSLWWSNFSVQPPDQEGVLPQKAFWPFV